MPLRKASYARISGFESGSAGAIAGRLTKVAFGLNSDVHVIAANYSGNELDVELALRRETEGQTFDTEMKRFVGEKRYDYRQHQFTVEGDSALASTPGAKRDFRLLIELLRRCGAASAELVDLQVDIYAWTQAFLGIYESAQFGAMVVDNYFTEPRMIGRYSAKSIDNRLDMGFLEQHASQLRSIRFSIFADGIRRSIEARRDMVLAVNSGEDDDLDGFFEDQIKLLRRFSSVREDESMGS